MGKPLSVTNASGSTISDASHIANVNPIRYRGYFYDTETKLYYCNSRYYDPQVKRFINADEFVSTGQGFLGFNMFAYCGNNPVVYGDESGERYCAETAVNLESEYDRHYACYWQKNVVMEKYNPEPIGKTERGNVYFVHHNYRCLHVDLDNKDKGTGYLEFIAIGVVEGFKEYLW